MTPTVLPAAIQLCHCFAVRQAGRWMTQLYDSHLAACGLRSSQFSVLVQLKELGSASMAELAEAMVMDRTTVTRTVTPLQRDGLLEVNKDASDGRRRLLTLTAEGRRRLAAAAPHWRHAQAKFEAHFGVQKAAEMRGLLHDVAVRETV
jgi:DNA-binding MarR family transcriptional regulator